MTIAIDTKMTIAIRRFFFDHFLIK